MSLAAFFQSLVPEQVPAALDALAQSISDFARWEMQACVFEGLPPAHLAKVVALYCIAAGLNLAAQGARKPQPVLHAPTLEDITP